MVEFVRPEALVGAVDSVVDISIDEHPAPTISSPAVVVVVILVGLIQRMMANVCKSMDLF